GQPHSVGALFEDGPHDWHLSRLLLEAACNTLTLDKIPRIQGLEDAVTVLSSLRSRFDRSAANPHLEAIIPLERELRRQTAKERQVDYSVLGGMMSESLSATAGAPKPFRTAAWASSDPSLDSLPRLRQILVKRILSSSQQGFNLVLAAAGVTAEMLMEVGRSAARIAVESAPRSQLERKLFDKRDDGDDNDESRASQPFHAFAQTKSFNLSACDRTPRMTAQTQLDTWRAENPDVFDPPPPGASQADLKPRGTKKTNMSDALGEVQKLIQNNLDSVVSDKRALKMTAAALSAGLVRGKWQSGWFLSAALERFTRAMARVYLNRAELDGVYEQVMRVVYCSFLVAWLAPTAGIAGMIYDSEIELLTLTSNIPHLGQVVIGEVSKDVHGGIFSIEFLTTKYASHRVRDVTWIGETGGIDPRHYMYGIQLQKEICGETLTDGLKITVNVLLRRNPLQLKDGLSKETAFGCLYTIFQYLFIAGLELSAARLFILAHVDDKPSRGKGLTSLILSDENGVVVTQEVVGDVDGEEIGAEREEIGLEVQDARLIGIEYVVDEEIFRSLPEDEKKYWHSHKHEVESGQLNLISKDFVPMAAEDLAEQGAMKELHRTYGKTIHTWNFDESPTVPLGPPRLMMAFTADGQVDPSIISKRDEVEQRSTEHKRELRAQYLDTSYEPLPGADQAMKTGKGIRFEPVEVDVERPSPAQQATWKGKEEFESVLKGEHEKV
ncbi:hypothetical protein JCM8097_005147, partial [Rhodosporidiobolus ruineniae]